MGEPQVVIALWIVKILMFVYDVITYPVYLLIQKPWTRWNMNSVIYSRRLRDDDPASPVVKIPLREKKYFEYRGIETMDQLFKRIVQKYGNKRLAGTREKLGEEQEIQKNGKVFKKFILGEYKWLTYNQIDQRAEDFSRGLLNLGMKPRQSIAMLAETRVEWMIAAQACFRINLPVITLYATLGEEGIKHAINETEVTHLITSQDLLPKVQKIANKLPMMKCIIYMEGLSALQHQFDSSIQVLPFKEVELLREPYQQLSAGDKPVPEDTIIIMYTSGSTGVPKGVIITHKNMITAFEGYAYMSADPGPDDLYIAYLPLAHSLELTAECYCMASGVLIGYSSPLTLTSKSTAVRKQDEGDIILLKPTLFTSVPMILDKICKSILEVVTARGKFQKELFLYLLKYKQFWTKYEFQTPILNSLVFNKIKAMVGGRIRAIGCGGAPLCAETQDFVRVCLDCSVGQGYGLTETAAGATVSELADKSSGHVGAPLTGCYIKLVNWEEGGYHIIDKPNPRGEMVIGGDTVTKGYFKNPELTKESYFEEDGIRWFYSGDIGEFYPNGTFRIIDRKKDILKLQHGEYISLNKIESVMKSCVLVENICVYGSSAKEYLVALVQPVHNQVKNLANTLGKGHLPQTELFSDPDVVNKATEIMMNHCRERKLLPVEIPKKYTLCTEEWIPATGLVTASLKLRRKAVQEFYEKDIERMYSS